MDNWGIVMSEIENDFMPNMMPLSCSARLTSFEDGIRISAELQSISEYGALVRLMEEDDLPSRLSILVPKYRINVGCHVVWRYRNDIGLRFDRKIEPPVPESLSA